MDSQAHKTLSLEAWGRALPRIHFLAVSTEMGSTSLASKEKSLANTAQLGIFP